MGEEVPKFAPNFQTKLQCMMSFRAFETLWIIVIGQNPSVSKSNRLRVVIFQLFFLSLGVSSIDFSKLTGDFHEILNFN